MKMMIALMIVLLGLRFTARAEDKELPLPAQGLTQGDTVTFFGPCNSKNVPATQEGVKVELNGRKGRVLMGATWTGVKVSKGSEAFDLKVVHRNSDDPVQLVKSGKFALTGTALSESGCRHTQEFKLYSPEDAPPCTGGPGHAIATPAGR